MSDETEAQMMEIMKSVARFIASPTSANTQAIEMNCFTYQTLWIRDAIDEKAERISPV